MRLRLFSRSAVTWSPQFYFGFGKLGTSQLFEFVLNFNQIINLIKKDISCRILCAKQDEKENFWSTGNILCKISDAHSISFFPYCS